MNFMNQKAEIVTRAEKVTKVTTIPSGVEGLVNKTGMIPVEYKCLVLPIEVEEKSAGGIILARETVEAEEVAQCKARLIDVGGIAFSDWGNGRNPKAGDTVLIAKYAGIVTEGIDGKTYRIIQDKDISAIIVG